MSLENFVKTIQDAELKKLEQEDKMAGLRETIASRDKEIRKLQGSLKDLSSRIEEMEDEYSNNHNAYRGILSQRDELFRENAILRTKIGCKTCEGPCYCKPVGGYEK